jgi:putative FmdB family regulatory protein
MDVVSTSLDRRGRALDRQRARGLDFARPTKRPLDRRDGGTTRAAGGSGVPYHWQSPAASASRPRFADPRIDALPTYQYRCTECDHAFEQFQSFTDDALTVCPACGGRLRKVFNAVGVVFKGSGFYRNDSRSTSSSSDAPSSSDSPSTSPASPKATPSDSSGGSSAPAASSPSPATSTPAGSSGSS